MGLEDNNLRAVTLMMPEHGEDGCSFFCPLPQSTQGLLCASATIKNFETCLKNRLHPITHAS